jgi:hypothetical protein
VDKIRGNCPRDLRTSDDLGRATFFCKLCCSCFSSVCKLELFLFAIGVSITTITTLFVAADDVY